jgi:DNA-binding Lrp family transcriptional regulator
MMKIAYVLLNVELGQGNQVVPVLEEIKHVTEIYSVYGVYDYVVKIEAESMSELKEVIMSKIRRINGVRSSLTLITFE